MTTKRKWANPDTMASRFWKKVDVRENEPGECWGWTGETFPAGYGRLQVGAHSVVAHRVSWMVNRGEIPEGMRVCHRCDNPPCTNPWHLFLGTDADNVADKVSKGRQRPGAEHPSAILSEDDVRAIRRAPESVSNREIATMYGISYSQAWNVRSGRAWKCVESEESEESDLG